MIKNLDLHQLPRIAQLFGEFLVMRAWRYVGAGMVMNTDDRLGKFLQCDMDYFPDNWKRLINSANGSIHDVDNAVIAIKVDNLKNFCFKITKLWHDDIHDILGRGDLLLPGGHIVLPMGTQYDRRAGKRTDYVPNVIGHWTQNCVHTVLVS